MANAPERPASLEASVFQQRLRAGLLAAYGCWSRDEGAALAPTAWFAVLAEAVQAEAQNTADAVSLCHFAFVDAPSALASDWAREALSREHSLAVIATALDALRPEAMQSPEAANAFWREVRHLLRDSHGLRGREVMDVLRAALTGASRGPCLGIVGALLGHDRTRNRLEEQRACLPRC